VYPASHANWHDRPWPRIDGQVAIVACGGGVSPAQSEGQLPSPGVHVPAAPCATGQEDPLPLASTLTLYCFVQLVEQADQSPRQSMSSTHDTDSLSTPFAQDGWTPLIVYPTSHANWHDRPWPSIDGHVAIVACGGGVSPAQSELTSAWSVGGGGAG